MLFPARFWPGLRDGSITVAFRRWKRPSVKPGGMLVSPAGLLAIDDVVTFSLEEITEEAARAAGYPDRAAVVADLRPEGTLYRVRFHPAGDDPRIELRGRDDLNAAEVDDLRRRLGRLPWALPVLRLIAAQPGVVSTELAPQVDMERAPFKSRVRRLKTLGLTESLEVGYRLSPRGRAVLARLELDRLDRDRHELDREAT